MPESLFVPDGASLVPTDLARGPWSPEHLHGGPVSALLARAVESAGAGVPMEVVRMTVELLRPVGLGPLSPEAWIERPGRKVQLAGAALRQSGAEVARARALRIRVRAMELPSSVPPDAGAPFPGPGESAPLETGAEPVAFHSRGAEIRFAGGAFRRPGPAQVWVRLRHPVLPDESPSPLQRAAAAADFGNGVSSPLAFGEWSFINPDLTVYLDRSPVGEWIGMDSRTHASANGIGLSESRLWDAAGPLGRSAQSLLVEPLAGGP